MENQLLVLKGNYQLENLMVKFQHKCLPKRHVKCIAMILNNKLFNYFCFRLIIICKAYIASMFLVVPFCFPLTCLPFKFCTHFSEYTYLLHPVSCHIEHHLNCDQNDILSTDYCASLLDKVCNGFFYIYIAQPCSQELLQCNPCPLLWKNLPSHFSHLLGFRMSHPKIFLSGIQITLN